MKKAQIIAGFIAILAAGCGRSDSPTTKEGAGNQTMPRTSVDTAMEGPIQLGKATTVVQPDGTKYDFTVQEYAAYQSDMEELAGRAAILIEIAPVSASPAVDIKKTTATAKLRDGSSVSLFGIRAFVADPNKQPMRIGSISTNKQVSVSYARDIKSSIGKYSASDPYGSPTYEFEANSDCFYSYDLKGTNAMCLGLILEAQFTNVESLTLFGKTINIGKQP